jgi:SAM-dependent methyltransferase
LATFDQNLHKFPVNTYTKALRNDIIEWDVINWSKALTYWEGKINKERTSLTCLELGARNGGLSLWLSQKGHKVICSDLHSPEAEASVLHAKYHCRDKIRYEAINATAIPYENHFDIVIFKSILGGISRDNNDTLKNQVLQQVHKSLKPGGMLLFAENTEASLLHKTMRKRFIKWGNEWNYVKIKEVPDLFSSFQQMEYITTGFWGTFGRNEAQRRFLGKIDRVFDYLIPARNRYILIGYARK